MSTETKPRTTRQIIDDMVELLHQHDKYTELGQTTQADQVRQDLTGLEQELKAATANTTTT